MHVVPYFLSLLILVGCEDAAERRDAPAGMVPGASSYLAEDIAALQAAAKAGDVDAVFAMMPAEAVPSGDAGADVVSFYKSLRLREPRPVVIAPDGAGCVIRFDAILHKDGEPLGRVTSSMVAVSDDDGASWKILQIDRAAAKSYMMREHPKLYETIGPTIAKFRTGDLD